MRIRCLIFLVAGILIFSPALADERQQQQAQEEKQQEERRVIGNVPQAANVRVAVPLQGEEQDAAQGNQRSEGHQDPSGDPPAPLDAQGLLRVPFNPGQQQPTQRRHGEGE